LRHFEDEDLVEKRDERSRELNDVCLIQAVYSGYRPSQISFERRSSGRKEAEDPIYFSTFNTSLSNHKMLIEQSELTVETSTGPMVIYLIKPSQFSSLSRSPYPLSFNSPLPPSFSPCVGLEINGYPNAKFPGVVVYSEIYQASAPVLRFANSIASQGSSLPSFSSRVQVAYLCDR